MRVALLAGGFGTRLSEETDLRPKPMVEIGGRPILWHIMSGYAAQGFDEFVIACGYRGEVIKSYFRDLQAIDADVEIDERAGTRRLFNARRGEWKITMIDTGLATMTGGRLKRLRPWLGDETFFATYGDGLSDVDFARLLEFHRAHGKVATVTAVRPPARFGALDLDGDAVRHVSEKPQVGEGWINGGFFVFEPSLFDLVAGDEASLEREPLETLARQGELRAFRHEGFWQPMDTRRERDLLEKLWRKGDAPWRGAR